MSVDEGAKVVVAGVVVVAGAGSAVTIAPQLNTSKSAIRSLKLLHAIMNYSFRGLGKRMTRGKDHYIS